MLIGFLGAPISGKTTTAALLFASLKDDGYVAEFLPEQARAYIAFKRYKESQPGAPEARPLDDRDQYEILRRQRNMELVFSTSSTQSIVITDCAAFLALLYMTPEGRVKEDVVCGARRSASAFDLFFRCHPVKPGDLYDPNRVHSFEQSQALDTQLEEVMKLAGVPPEKVIELAGPSNVRASRAYYEVMERKLGCLR
jgi:hypothetical protein